MATRVVPATLQQLPNALTIARLALIPVFVALMLSAEGGHSWPAGIIFGIAGVTDQIDGFLARRWRVESDFGRVWDPLADRLMIDAAVVLLFVADHMPWAGLVVILGRDLLREHGMTDVIVTVAFLPQAIRSYFGEGDTLGMSIGYSVEESPLGTAGSVRLAAKQLDETFLVISGDALCDVDLSALVAFHTERGAAVTIGLKSVENPLEFGIVVTDDEGRVERFLEKPSWGQVFSDTINTGIYVMEPEVLKHVPADR